MGALKRPFFCSDIYVCMRICRKCKSNKKIIDFSHVISSSGNICYRYKCKTCISEENKIRRKNNLDKIKEKRKTTEYKIKKSIWDKKYNTLNKEKISAKRADRYIKNKKAILAKQKIYTSSEKYKKHRREKQKTKKQFDPGFKLESIIKSKISTALKRQVKSNIAKSYFQILGYDRHQLKNYLESKFEPWMNWNNYGIYNSKIWDDLNQNTWTWQIDHIIPQSELKFTSIEDDNFKKCWGLDNLRPYSAKQNIIDGAKKIRHSG